MEDLLRWDPEKRPNAQQSLKYSFFQVIPLPAAVNNGRFETKSNFSMSPLESERNKQMSRMNYFNHPQQNKVIQQKQMMIENNFYNFASNAVPVAVAAAKTTKLSENEREDDEKMEANEQNEQMELSDFNRSNGAPYDSFSLVNNHSSKLIVSTRDSDKCDAHQDRDPVKGFKLNGANENLSEKAKIDKSDEILKENIAGGRKVANGIINFSNDSIKNNRNDEVGSSLNGSSIDLSQARRFSIRRPSRFLIEDSEIVAEKISDIYVNRNVNSLYTNFENDFVKKNAANHHSKGFFLHHGPANGLRMNVVEPKVYQVFTKQQSRESLLEKPTQKSRDAKRASVGHEKWGSFEEDELTSILGLA